MTVRWTIPIVEPPRANETVCSDRSDNLKPELSPGRLGTVEEISATHGLSVIDETAMTSRVRRSLKGFEPGRFQFSLSGLFWLTTVVAVACATLRATGLPLLDVVGSVLSLAWMFGPVVVYAVADLLPRSKGQHSFRAYTFIAVVLFLLTLGAWVTMTVAGASPIWFFPLVAGVTCFWGPQVILLWAVLRWRPITARHRAENTRLPDNDLLRKEPHEDDRG